MKRTTETSAAHEARYMGLPGTGRSGPRSILVVGAHADDIEIGCGGTLLRMLDAWPQVEIHWHVLSAPGPREREARCSAAAWLRGALKSHVDIRSFRESYFPDQWADIKGCIEQIRDGCEPDIIFTHCRDDVHQDHRVVCDLMWNTFRNHAILEYEIPKYEGDLGKPNLYVALDDRACRCKVAALMRHFQSQKTKAWFTEDTFYALLRLRGIECGARSHFAEAFHARKLVI